MRTHATRLFAVLFAITVATAALAVTVSELLDRANALDATYASLLSRADACPDGTCTDAAAIKSDLAAAEMDRTILKADRETLNPCTTCSTLDQVIAGVDLKAATMRNILDGWDGQS